jgi:hypothetical protein
MINERDFLFIIGLTILLFVLYFYNQKLYKEKFCEYNLSSFGNIYQQCMHPSEWGFKYSTGKCKKILK